MKNTLTIDTALSTETTVGLQKSGQAAGTTEKRQGRSQGVLPAIEHLLRSNELSLTDISEIQVATGPGSYTGLRVGIAVATTLSWLLQIPVNGNSHLAHQVMPVYDEDKYSH